MAASELNRKPRLAHLPSASPAASLPIPLPQPDRAAQGLLVAPGTCQALPSLRTSACPVSCLRTPPTSAPAAANSLSTCLTWSGRPSALLSHLLVAITSFSVCPPGLGLFRIPRAHILGGQLLSPSCSTLHPRRTRGVLGKRGATPLTFPNSACQTFEVCELPGWQGLGQRRINTEDRRREHRDPRSAVQREKPVTERQTARGPAYVRCLHVPPTDSKTATGMAGGRGKGEGHCYSGSVKFVNRDERVPETHCPPGAHSHQERGVHLHIGCVGRSHLQCSYRTQIRF